MSERALLTVDLDGVICGPPLGVNRGIKRVFLDPEAPPRRAVVPPRWLAAPFDYLRFNFRRPLPEAREALAALSELRRVVVLTGRRASPERWLRRHGLDRHLDGVVINDSADASPAFKLRCVRELGARAHIDDDGRTAQYLAQRGDVRVYLRDWPRNRNLAFDPAVTRVTDLGELARLLSEEAAAGHDEARD